MQAPGPVTRSESIAWSVLVAVVAAAASGVISSHRVYATLLVLAAGLLFSIAISHRPRTRSAMAGLIMLELLALAAVAAFILWLLALALGGH